MPDNISIFFCIEKDILLSVLLFWNTPSDWAWFCTQEFSLAGLGGPFGMPGIENGWAECKASTLTKEQFL